MRWRLILPWPLLATGCFWFGGSEPPLEPVQERDVLAFASRIEGFYRELEAVPLDVMMTYDNPDLRAHFPDAAAFADYYASLASQIRRAQLRNGRAERIEIRDFYFEGPELAHVDVALIGHHQRALRFWEIQLSRTDTWRLVNGAWVLSPGKL